MTEEQILEIAKQYERLKDFIEVGPIQKYTVVAFAEELLAASSDAVIRRKGAEMSLSKYATVAEWQAAKESEGDFFGRTRKELLDYIDLLRQEIAPMEDMRDMLKECLQFLEDMHIQPPDVTVEESQLLHTRIEKLLASDRPSQDKP